jgi:hypothetical protein
MSQSNLDTDRVVQLLLQDALPAFGERARAEVLRLAANYAVLAREWVENGDTIAEAQCSYDGAVVEGLQEAAHDLYWDTTWPACPRHLRHPLWYDPTQQAWSCREDPTIVTPLGRLASLSPRAT